MPPTLEDELALVSQMPLAYNALVIEYTSRCNAQCAMCYQAAGPRGSDLIGRATLDVAIMEQVIRDAAGLETIAPRCHITGGEGFLSAETLLHLVNVARDAGFAEMTTTTNAFWARDLKRAQAMCARARHAGMTGMEISWDHWHEPYVSAEAVSNCLEACFDVGIETNLRILSSRSHACDDALRSLRLDALGLATRITCAPVMPTGRAAVRLPLTDMYDHGTLNDTCHSILNLTVNARGGVSPCCSGLDQLGYDLFGNVKGAPLADIVRRMDRSLLIRLLVFRGVLVLARLLDEIGVSVAGRFTSICHQCSVMFSDPAIISALDEALRRRQSLAIQRALVALRGHASESP